MWPQPPVEQVLHSERFVDQPPAEGCLRRVVGGLRGRREWLPGVGRRVLNDELPKDRRAGIYGHPHAL